MGVLIRRTGTIEEVEPCKNDSYTYEQLQVIVGFYPRLFSSHDDDRVMVIDDQAEEKGKLYNPKATSVIRKMGHSILVSGDALVCTELELF